MTNQEQKPDGIVAAASVSAPDVFDECVKIANRYGVLESRAFDMVALIMKEALSTPHPLEAENKRLREALETIDGASMSQFANIAHFLEFVLRTASTAIKGDKNP